jgi:hypothetical protein
MIVFDVRLLYVEEMSPPWALTATFTYVMG